MISSKTKLYNIVFCLGLPSAGKGTQCRKIQNEFGLKHLSAGELLRAERNKPTSPYREMIEDHIREGTIVSSKVTELQKAGDNKNFIIDGFPRNRENLDGWQSEMGDTTDLKLVLYFNSSAESCVTRSLKRGRKDDVVEIIHKRIQNYRKETLPVIRYFEEQNLVRTIDVTKTPDEIYAQIQKIFKNLIW